MRFPALGAGFFIRSVSLVAAAIGLLALAAPAQAAFPGVNGKIAFVTDRDGNNEIYTMDADGTNQTRLTTNTASDEMPAWSPDGQKIAFTSDRDGNSEIYTMNADGTNQTRLTKDPASDAAPSWSPDDRITFASYHGGNWEIYTMNADGTNQTRLTRDRSDDETPKWSPSATKIAFRRSASGSSKIYTMNTDGTNQVNISGTNIYDRLGDWSPDSQNIVFDVTSAILTMSADGDNRTLLAECSNFPCAGDFGVLEAPVWSPDGLRIAFSHRDCFYTHAGAVCTSPDIATMNADGTGIFVIGYGDSPSWQAVAPPYPRPVGASPLRVALVPAFEPCEAANADSQHGPPLDFASCSNPQPTSSTVTIGSNALGFTRMVVCPLNATTAFCNPTPMPKPDVRLTGSIRDVQCRQTGTPAGCTAGADYDPNPTSGPYASPGNGTGAASPFCFPSATSSSDCVANADLTETAFLGSPASTSGGTGAFGGHGVRMTDSFNGGSQNDSATVTDLAFPIPLDCLADANVPGSTCGVNTTANALYPGVVVNGQAAVWQIGQVELKDSGPDGVRGNSDDQVFATQGVFLP